MDTKNSFATTLKQVRIARGMSMQEFPEEAGIALSSLVGYEAGRRLPRGDTVEQIAARLHISPASLISVFPSDDLGLRPCLEYISSYIQSMHPNTRTSAGHALDLLLLAARTSADLFSMESHAAPPEDPSAIFRYILHETHPSPSYGMLVEELRDGVWSAFAVFAPFSRDRLTALQVVFSANALQLPPDRFFSDVLPELLPPPCILP